MRYDFTKDVIDAQSATLPAEKDVVDLCSLVNQERKNNPKFKKLKIDTRALLTLFTVCSESKINLQKAEDHISEIYGKLYCIADLLKKGETESVQTYLFDMLVSMNLIDEKFRPEGGESNSSLDSEGNPQMSVPPVGADKPKMNCGTETPCNTTSAGVHMSAIDQIGAEVKKNCDSMADEEKSSAAQAVQDAVNAASDLAQKANRLSRRNRKKAIQYSADQSQDPAVKKAKTEDRKPQKPSKRQKARNASGCRSYKSEKGSRDPALHLFCALTQSRGLTFEQTAKMYERFKAEFEISSLPTCNYSSSEGSPVCNGKLVEIDLGVKDLEKMIIDITAYLDRFCSVVRPARVRACSKCRNFFPDRLQDEDGPVFPGAPLSSSMFASMIVDNRFNNVAINKIASDVNDVINISRAHLDAEYNRAKLLVMRILSSVIESAAALQDISHIDETTARCLIGEQVFKQCASIQMEKPDDPSFVTGTGKKGYVLVTSTPKGAVVQLSVYSAADGRSTSSLEKSVWYLLPKDLDESLEDVMPEVMTLIADGYTFYNYMEITYGFEVQRCLVHVRRVHIRAGNPKDYAAMLSLMTEEERESDLKSKIKAGNDQLITNTVLYMLNSMLRRNAVCDRIMAERNNMSAQLDNPEIKAESDRMYAAAADIRAELKVAAALCENTINLLEKHYKKNGKGNYVTTRKSAISEAAAYLKNANITNMPAWDNPEIPLQNNQVELCMRVISRHRKTIMQHVSKTSFSSDMDATTVLETLKKNAHTDLTGKLQEIVSLISYDFKALMIADGVEQGLLRFSTEGEPLVDEAFTYGSYETWFENADRLPLGNYIEHIFDTVACASLNEKKDLIERMAVKILRKNMAEISDYEFRTEEQRNLNYYEKTMSLVSSFNEALPEKESAQLERDGEEIDLRLKVKKVKSSYDQTKYRSTQMKRYHSVISRVIDDEYTKIKEFKDRFMSYIEESGVFNPKLNWTDEWQDGAESSETFSVLLKCMTNLDRYIHDSEKIPEEKYYRSRLFHARESGEKCRIVNRVLTLAIRRERSNTSSNKAENMNCLYRIYLKFASLAESVRTSLIEAYNRMLNIAEARTIEAKEAYDSIKKFLPERKKVLS